jgi:hypothetical protein
MNLPILKEFLSQVDRQEFAKKCRTTPGYLNLLIYDSKRQPGIKLSMRMVEASNGQLTLADLREEFTGDCHK